MELEVFQLRPVITFIGVPLNLITQVLGTDILQLITQQLVQKQGLLE